MHILALTLLVAAAVSQGSHYKKCCKSTEVISQFNSTYYSCAGSRFKRLGILTNDTDFIKTNSSGQCVDVGKGDGIFVYNVTEGKIVGKRNVAEKFFPKCCPLGYTYNSILHSCDKNESTTHGYIKENFVKVGLPNCKLIVDYDLNDTLDSYSKLEYVEDALQYQESYCIDKKEDDTFILRVCKESIDICDHIRCIKKCCPDGQSFINRSECFDTYTHGVNLSSFSMVEKPDEPYAVISGRSCRMYILNETKYTFGLDERGNFSYWSQAHKSFIFENVRQANSYCIEHVKMKHFEGYLFFMCFPAKVKIQKFEYTLWPKILSCIFLTLTIVIYVILNETKNVFGKILVNYCVALLLQNALLTYAHQSLHPSKIDCILRGFFLIFLSTSAYTWSNVVCYDIWRTFGSTRRTLGQYYKKRVLKKLVPYLIYGWGIPTVITLVVYAFYSYKVLPASVQPLLGKIKCFFENKEGNYSKVLFLNLPDLIMQMVNIVLFVKTAAYCFKIKKEINKIDDTTRDDKNKKFQKDKERLFLILKLSIIMGISFTFEVVSAFFDMKEMGVVPKYIEIVWDIVNCLQGVFIFIIFICKRKVLREFLKKFKVIIPRKTSASSLYTQSTTALGGNVNKTSVLERETQKLAATFH